jgi:hypothetical protein
MKLNSCVLNFSLSIFLLLSLTAPASADRWSNEFYSQSVYLHRFGNPVTQNRVIVAKEMKSYDVYLGAWFEHDSKSDGDVTYTDSQISPLIGIRSSAMGNEWMFSRFFAETRLVHRTRSFFDDRERTTFEARGGLLGYGMKMWDESLFLENYYSAFYTRLYNDRFIFQGWARQGIRLVKHLEFFNEIFLDTFDFTRDADSTFDLRPGVRLRYDFAGGGVQLIHQRLHHFSNLEFSGRNESRTSLVFGYYW